MLDSEPLRLASARGRWVLAATVLGSGLAGLDATVVNIALPAIGRDLGGSFSQLQWTVDAYLLTLASFLLIGGALGDRYGRRRIFTIGVAWFTGASLLCGLAPTASVLTAARALQGVGGALLSPGSLAILEASFQKEDRGAAIGAWSALGGVAMAIGPFVGGYLIQALSWRLVFLINLPLALLTMVILQRHAPESRDPAAPARLDLSGAALAALALGGITYALIEAPGHGFAAVDVKVAGSGGVVALVAFFLVERRQPAPMLDLGLFRVRAFAVTNAQTLLIYAGLSGTLFLLPMALQQQYRYSPIAAGAALLPATVLMLLLASASGRLAHRIGPRPQLTVGPLMVALSLVMLRDAGPRYLTSVLPGAIVFGLGLATTVAPLTATVLAAAPSEKAGIASAINNCVARTGGLLAVALLPALAGARAQATLDGGVFRRGLVIAAGLCAAGGLLALAGAGRPRARTN
jgi:EmrB/QacA subfamily drug resistance transporter